MITLSMVMHFLGGLGLFLYGVHSTSSGLQKIAANKLKAILESITKRTWVATLFGMVMTVALQSSAATTVMVVEFVNSGLMTLVQALGVALGSTVGTSMVIQLISFPILDIALFLIFIGFVLFFIIRTQRAVHIGQALIGFGSIFVGISYLSGAFAPLKNSPEVYVFLSHFGDHPLLGVLVAIAVTALIQSSAAFLAILISLSGHGLLTIDAIIPLVLGAQIGGTMTTLISSLGAERIDAKRVAIANSIYRITAAVLLLPLAPYLAMLVQWSADDLPRQVANTHLFSALFMVIVFLPLNSYLAKALVRFVPQRKGKEHELQTVYITKAALEVPVVALSQARQEIRWLSHRILDNMLQILPRVMSTGDPKWLAEMERAERQIDWHYEQLSIFLKALFRKNMTRQQIVENHGFQLIAKEFEYIADSLIVMARLGQKIHQQKIEIAPSDWERLEELYMAVADNYLSLLQCLDRRDTTIACRIAASHNEIISAYNLLQGSIACRVPNNGSAAESENKPPTDIFSDGHQAILELGNWFYKIGEHMISITRVMQ